MIDAKHAVLRTGRHRTPEKLAAAVDRHDAVTSPSRLRDHEERARQLSPEHHRNLDAAATQRALRTMQQHPDTLAALQEIGRAHAQAEADAAATHAWQTSARRQQAIENLVRLREPFRPPALPTFPSPFQFSRLF